MRPNPLSLSCKRLLVLSGNMVWTVVACRFLVLHLFRPASTDRLDLLANVVFVLLKFTGNVNFILYLLGLFVFPRTASRNGRRYSQMAR